MFNFAKQQLLLIIIVSLLYNKILLSNENPSESDKSATKEDVDPLLNLKESFATVFHVVEACEESIRHVDKNVATLVAEAFKIKETNDDNRFKSIENNIATLPKQITEVESRLGSEITRLENQINQLDNQTTQIFETYYQKFETVLKINADFNEKKSSFNGSQRDVVTKEYVDGSIKNISIMTEELKRDKNRSSWYTKEGKLDYINHNKTSIATGILATYIVYDKLFPLISTAWKSFFNNKPNNNNNNNQ